MLNGERFIPKRYVFFSSTHLPRFSRVNLEAQFCKAVEYEILYLLLYLCRRQVVYFDLRSLTSCLWVARQCRRAIDPVGRFSAEFRQACFRTDYQSVKSRKECHRIKQTPADPDWRANSVL